MGYRGARRRKSTKLLDLTSAAKRLIDKNPTSYQPQGSITTRLLKLFGKKDDGWFGR